MALRLEGLGLVHSNGHRALRDLNLRIGFGERVAVIGPSGAGKTSLLRCAATALRPTEGRLDVLGTAPWSLPPAQLRRLRAHIGLIHQSPPLPPRQRVVTAVLAGRLGHWSTVRALASLAMPRDIEGAEAALARLDLAERLFDRCDRLSGGQLQRVGIARVLYQAPDLLLADEPVSALDPATADRAVATLVAHSRDIGATLLASLHAVDLARRWFDRLVGLRDGAVLFDAPTAQVSDLMLRELYANEAAAPPALHGSGNPIHLRPAAAPLLCR